MTPISGLALLQNPTPNDFIPVVNDGVTKKIKFADVLDAIVPRNAAARNSVPRGISLGTSVTAEQYAEISAGTFGGIMLHDYWIINGVVWRVMGFDYWLHTGDTSCETHHVVVVPDTILYTAQMNTTNIVTGAYVGSEMYISNLATAKSTINSAFGSGHILKHREFLKNAVTGNYETAGAWYDSTVELMTEEMVYGGKEFKNAMQGEHLAYNQTIDKSQLPGFAADPSRITNRAYWWLRDVAHSPNFALVDTGGYCGNSYASHSLGVRPAFGICA